MAQVTTGPTPKKTFNLGRDLAIALVVIIAVVAFFIGWYAGRHHKNYQNNNVAAGWVVYKNPENGFQFQYPDSWGSPSFSSIETQGIKHYILDFSKAPNGNSKYTIAIWMDASTSTSSNGKCTNNQCSAPNAISSDTVNTVLKSKKSVTASDSSSFATVSNSPDSKNTVLNEIQIVSLPKIKVTAARLSYSISVNDTKCPANKFSTDSNGKCIEKSDYDTVNKVLKSIKGL